MHAYKLSIITYIPQVSNFSFRRERLLIVKFKLHSKWKCGCRQKKRKRRVIKRRRRKNGRKRKRHTHRKSEKNCKYASRQVAAKVLQKKEEE